MKSQVLHAVWCNISGEATGEIWNWSLLGDKGLTVVHLRNSLTRGKFRINSSAPASSAAIITSFSVQPSFAWAMFSAIVALKNSGFLWTIPICRRYQRRSSSRMSWPSSRTWGVTGSETPWKYVFDVTSVGERSSPWPYHSGKVEIKFRLECMVRFPFQNWVATNTENSTRGWGSSTLRVTSRQSMNNKATNKCSLETRPPIRSSPADSCS